MQSYVLECMPAALGGWPDINVYDTVSMLLSSASAAVSPALQTHTKTLIGILSQNKHWSNCATSPLNIVVVFLSYNPERANAGAGYILRCEAYAPALARMRPHAKHTDNGMHGTLT